jgi:hypothetical protein
MDCRVVGSLAFIIDPLKGSIICFSSPKPVSGVTKDVLTMADHPEVKKPVNICILSKFNDNVRILNRKDGLNPPAPLRLQIFPFHRLHFSCRAPFTISIPID